MAEYISDTIDFSAYLKETDAQAKVKPAHLYASELKQRLRSKPNEKRCFLPWPDSRKYFDFKTGDMTIWGGVNGHGKSLVTAFVALSLMDQGYKVCLANFELKPIQTIERLARMYCGMNPYSPEFQSEDGIASLDALYDSFSKWSMGKLWLYDQHGMAEASKVLAVTRYCSRELGINHIFIDNLAKCVRAEDDYNGQKLFVDQLFAAGRDESIHVHLVHHLRKGNKETDFIDKNDFKGSGSITDQPDNLIGVWRNKGKENDVRMNGNMAKLINEPDVILKVFKQRNCDNSLDDEPQLNLWFDRDSWQYRENPGDRLMEFGNAYIPNQPAKVVDMGSPDDF